MPDCFQVVFLLVAGLCQVADLANSTTPGCVTLVA
jgi:hypothetical protein